MGAGDFDAWLIKVDGSGVQQWAQTYGGEAWDAATCVAGTPDGGFVLAGMTRSHGAWSQAWLIRTDSSGAPQWEKAFGGSGDEWGYSVKSTADGGFIMAGSTTDAPGGLDAYLVYYRP